MKRCNSCGAEKPVEMFYKAATSDGRDGRCMECVRAARRLRYHANPTPDREQAAAWSKANPERHAQAARTHYDRNVEEIRAKARELMRRIREMGRRSPDQE